MSPDSELELPWQRETVKRDSKGKAVGWQPNEKDLTHSISQYGLVNHHIPLLQGVTLAPERRTGIIRSLGPLTQAILLTIEDKYHTKLSNALMNSLQMLPMAREIVECLKELGDILIITTARSTQKIYFPLILTKIIWAQSGSASVWSF